MERLKVKIEAWGKTVVMQVLYMDEELRGKGKIFRHNNIVLYSQNMPEIHISHEDSRCDTTIYLRGNECEKDLSLSAKEFDSEETAQEMVKNINQCIDEFNSQPKEIKYRDGMCRVKIGESLLVSREPEHNGKGELVVESFSYRQSDGFGKMCDYDEIFMINLNYIILEDAIELFNNFCEIRGLNIRMVL